MINEILNKLGLDEKDTQIYLALIRLGPSSASVVSKETSLPRQTVYSILDQLVTKDILEQGDNRGVRQFIADPNHLVKLLERRREDLEISKNELVKVIPTLFAENKRAKAFPVVQYYDGQEGLKRLFMGILDIYKKGKNKSFRGYGINNFYPGLEGFLNDFLKERASYGVKADLMIANAPDEFDTKTQGNEKLGRVIKKINIEPQKAGVYLVANRIYLFSYEDNVGVMIENQAISQLLKDIFDEHWERVNK